VWEGSPDPDDLFLIQLPLPELEPGDVLVRNSMIGLNPDDWKNLECKPAEWLLGHVPGADGAGIVVAVDERVPNAWLGTRVAYNQSLDRSGSFAEYTAVSVRNLMRLPASVGWVDAASFPTPALTAWLAMTNLAKHGDRLLISGTARSTAHYLIQLAAQSGHSVTIMGNRHDCARLSTLGAIEQLDGPLSKPWQNERRFDSVIDLIDARHARWLLPSLYPKAHLISVGNSSVVHVDPEPGGAVSFREVALSAVHNSDEELRWSDLINAGELMLQALGARTLRRDVVREMPFERLSEHLCAVKDGVYSAKALVRL
jgi:NADPH:quinone reductase-like Zn-dependent oxidoreductase